MYFFFALAVRCAVQPLRGGFTVSQTLRYTQKIILGAKGSRKNNFAFWHLIFKSFLAYFKNQKP